ncbi:hypothetical protein DL96DRAFT_1559881 [Flagelloscypha sp. PMI_526]|nr:hypothetical protein DL96DRAFT_1559881 [Flagelloscypha sp. PMI_526]
MIDLALGIKLSAGHPNGFQKRQQQWQEQALSIQHCTSVLRSNDNADISFCGRAETTFSIVGEAKLPEDKETTEMTFSGIPGFHSSEFLDSSRWHGKKLSEITLRSTYDILSTALFSLPEHQSRRLGGDLQTTIFIETVIDLLELWEPEASRGATYCLQARFHRKTTITEIACETKTASTPLFWMYDVKTSPHPAIFGEDNLAIGTAEGACLTTVDAAGMKMDGIVAKLRNGE